MYKGLVTDIFFDLDHTLWDFDKNSALTFSYILDKHKITIPLSDFLQVYVPKNLAFWKMYREEQITKEELRYQRLKQTFDDLRITIKDETIHSLADAYIEYLSSFNHLFPGTLEILTHLKPNYNLHIITNGFQEVQEKKMINSGIRPFFDQIIDSETAGVKKPNPIIFNVALKRAQTTPKKSVMIGDSLEADIQGARALGFYTLHFNSHNESSHNYGPMINHLNEIKSFL